MKGRLKSIVVFVFSIVAINIVIMIFESMNRKENEDFYEEGVICDEFLQEDQETKNRLHQREWHVYDNGGTYCLGYESLNSIKDSEAENRAEMRIRISEQNFWGAVYGYLVKHGRTNLDHLVDSLKNVANVNTLSNQQLAKLTVSFVQDIPYSYVVPGSCSDYQSTGKPCLGNIPYGIIGPYEFAHTLYGDCDTRAVLLYVLLEKMNFDPMIVVSDQYAHAMIALSIPAHGDHLEHGGKKYYFWETTGTGWPIGMLPPDTNNLDYWEIALVNES